MLDEVAPRLQRAAAEAAKAGRDGAVNRPPPVVGEVEPVEIGATTIDRFHEAEAQHEGLDRVQAQVDHRLTHRAARAGESIEARIDGPKHLRRQRLIHLHHFGDATDVDVVFGRHLQHTSRDRGKGGQAVAVDDVLDGLLLGHVLLLG